MNPWRDLRTFFALVGLIRRFRPDIVETHTAKAGFLGRLAALTLRPRPVIIHTYHGHVLEGYFGRMQERVFRALERLLAGVSDALVGVSTITVDDLVRMRIAPREKFRVIPHGLELGELLALDRSGERAFRDEVGAGPDEVLFVFVGRLVPIKRVDVLLRALGVAATAEPAVRLAIVGGGESSAELEALARELDLDDRVTFCGYRSDLAHILRGADVAILSSANEGIPIALIEAGAAGLPVVGTDVGGVRDMVTPSTGMLVPPLEPELLARAIATLAGDQDLRSRLGQAARDHVRAHFTADRLAAAMHDLYRELLAGRH